MKGLAHDIITSYLSSRKQCVKIRKSTSHFKDIVMGVPQGSILGPVLFLIYINDLPKISSKVTCLSYADDTALIFHHANSNLLQDNVNTVLKSITEWFRANFLSLNVQKTFTQHYSIASTDFRVTCTIDDQAIEEKDEIRYLGIIIDQQLKFSAHISNTASKVSRNIGIIGRIRPYIDRKTTYLLYNTLILSQLNYCCMIWGVNYHSQISKLVILQKRAVRMIENIYPPHSSLPIFKQFKILKLEDLAKSQMIVVTHKFITNQLPTPFNSIFSFKQAPAHATRRIDHLEQPLSNRNYRLFTTPCLGPKLWNDIFVPHFSTIRDVPLSKYTIKRISRAYFISQYE